MATQLRRYLSLESMHFVFVIIYFKTQVPDIATKIQDAIAWLTDDNKNK